MCNERFPFGLEIPQCPCALMHRIHVVHLGRRVAALCIGTYPTLLRDCACGKSIHLLVCFSGQKSLDFRVSVSLFVKWI